jgi:hypothetical protein
MFTPGLSFQYVQPYVWFTAPEVVVTLYLWVGTTACNSRNICYVGVGVRMAELTSYCGPNGVL